MDNNMYDMSEKILNLTLEIIHLLTGEDYLVVKESANLVTSTNYPRISEEFSRTQRPIRGHLPYSPVHENNKNQAILNLINRILELLTGEVPIRCQDVTVYFSMEEWEYLEEHKDLYKDIMMEKHLSPTSLDSSSKRNPQDINHSPLYFEDLTVNSVQHDHQDEDLIVIKGNTLLEESYLMGDRPCEKEELMPFISQASEHTSTFTAEEYLLLSQDCDIEDNAGHIAAMSSNSFDHEYSLEFGDQTNQTAVKPFECSDCGKCFAQKSYLRKHQVIHSTVKPFICNVCGKRFSRSESLVLHHRIHSGVKPFICSECEKSFGCKSDLVKHQRTHTGEKPFLCAECGKSFSRKCTLLQHYRTHTGEKPFMCTWCMKNFACKSVLRKHTRIHTGEKPYPCTECGRCFTFKSDLKNHYKIHTGEKLFPCSKCGKCFARKSSLAQHRQTHREEKQFVCPTCGKFFTRKYTLVEHQKTHKDETLQEEFLHTN